MCGEKEKNKSENKAEERKPRMMTAGMTFGRILRSHWEADMKTPPS
jgi:hypothetical protein